MDRRTTLMRREAEESHTSCFEGRGLHRPEAERASKALEVRRLKTPDDAKVSVGFGNTFRGVHKHF